MELHDMSVVNSHPDVNGKWGGYKAWMVRYESYDGKQGSLEVYRHVGDYYKIGNWPGDYGPSKWGVVSRCVEYLDGQVPLRKLVLVAIEWWLKQNAGKVGRVILEFVEFRYMLRKARNWLFREERE